MGTSISNSKREDLQGYAALKELALNFNWSWSQNHLTDKVWERLDPELWKLTRNPWTALKTVSREKLAAVLEDKNFHNLVEGILSVNRTEMSAPGWFQKHYGKEELKGIAYFSMEYMLGEALPIYSGGLGNVAGDQLKAASDLGVPVTGIGLLYQQGYFRQVIDNDGVQKAFYPYNSPEQLPIMPARLPNGEWLRIEIALPGWSVWLRVWEVLVGRVKLYLIDTNDPANYPPHRGITSELYGGDAELRLKQEIVLGISGWRVLEAMGIAPDVCHLNEGHAAFAVLERANSFMKKEKISFEEALMATRPGNLFTTHTAVPAGFDRFPAALVERYLGNYAAKQLGISMKQLLALGRQNPEDEHESFNMAYLALRGSGAVNGVSRLHSQVSRNLFSPLFPRWPESEVPVGYVTNGVHVPSWVSETAGKFWEKSCGKNFWAGASTESNGSVYHHSDAGLWRMRNSSREALVKYCRERLGRTLEARGAASDWVELARQIFDPNVLTLGFARRFATYKRPNLLLNNPERLLKLLTNPNAPVQLVIAGKAHPADRGGQALIQQWMRFIMRPEVRPHVMFIEDYDMLVTQQLVRGVDLWVNTPRRPWEACGTSGMKVLANGGLNLSELDGWWAEAYSPAVGWALGDGLEHGEDPAMDDKDAERMYTLLETEIVPKFYHRDSEGIPTQWIAHMRESMARLTPQYSADRAVRDYTEKYYLPCNKAYRERTQNKAELAHRLCEELKSIEHLWGGIRFGESFVETNSGAMTYLIQLYLGELKPELLQVELYAQGSSGQSPEVRPMECAAAHTASPGLWSFKVEFRTERPQNDYTVRVRPAIKGLTQPLEFNAILWQH